MTRFRWLVAGVAALAVSVALALAQLPALGAGGLLHPARRQVTVALPPSCESATFIGEGVTLKGWRCSTSGRPRGTLVYLHGIADNRSGAAGLIERFGKQGFDVVAYDSRAHGDSGGAACTYGFFEKQDLSRVLDTVRSGPVVLIGTSLGAAVALQEAAEDPRVTGIVAAEVFSDLRTVAADRAPFVFPTFLMERAFHIAERQGGFRVDAVSPVLAARAVKIPVLLIHGAADTDTPAEHSKRVLAALSGPKQLVLVQGARHNESLRGEVWSEIDRWIDHLVPRTSG
jgi:uncharacterized protein